MQVNNILSNKTNSPAFNARLSLNDGTRILQKAERAILNRASEQIGSKNDSVFIGCQRFLNADNTSNVEALVMVKVGDITERGIITNETTKTGAKLSQEFCKDLINLISTINRDIKRTQLTPQPKDTTKSFWSKLVDIFK